MGSNIAKENENNLPSKFCAAYRHPIIKTNNDIKKKEDKKPFRNDIKEAHSNKGNNLFPIPIYNEKHHKAKENENFEKEISLGNSNHNKPNLKRSEFSEYSYLTRNYPSRGQKILKDNQELLRNNLRQDSFDNPYHTLFYYEPVTLYEKIPVNKENLEFDSHTSFDFCNYQTNKFIENHSRERSDIIISKDQLKSKEFDSPTNIKISNIEKNYAKSSEKSFKNVIQVVPKASTKLLKLHYDYKNIQQNMKNTEKKIIAKNNRKSDLGYNHQLEQKQNYVNQDLSLLNSDMHSINFDYQKNEKYIQNSNTLNNSEKFNPDTKMKESNHAKKMLIERKASLNETKVKRPITQFRKSLIEYENPRKIITGNSPQHLEAEKKLQVFKFPLYNN